MGSHNWGPSVPEADRRDQLKLVYDYVKFHIGLYIATPAALSVIADGYDVKHSFCFIVCLSIAIVIYLAAGALPGLFMARHVISPWQDDYLDKFQAEAFSARRRYTHHTLYWLGLIIGLSGLVVSIVLKYRSNANSGMISNTLTLQSYVAMFGAFFGTIGSVITAFSVSRSIRELNIARQAIEISIDAISSPQNNVPIFTGLDQRALRADRHGTRLLWTGVAFLACGFILQAISICI